MSDGAAPDGAGLKPQEIALLVGAVRHTSNALDTSSQRPLCAAADTRHAAIVRPRLLTWRWPSASACLLGAMRLGAEIVPGPPWEGISAEARVTLRSTVVRLQLFRGVDLGERLARRTPTPGATKHRCCRETAVDDGRQSDDQDQG